MWRLGWGRLLTCDGEGALPCALLDPLSGERQAVPGNVDLVRSGVALDSGQIFVRLRQPLLLDPETGAARELPRPPRDLTQRRTAALFRGRLAFWSRQKALCHELMLWLGEQRGFQLLSAGPAGHCVHEVFDLGDGRVLVAMDVLAKQRYKTDG